MKKIFIYIPCIAAIITFIMGYFTIDKNDVALEVLYFSLSIILFLSAATLKISIKIDELKCEMKERHLIK